ncbi:MAG: response regulator [Nitrososphaeraceae archaeon]|jgi:DNA-binding response OmpR family regulator|nr:response regulator [Nitrososphaeraceae archaeon]MDW0170673.1 response regulator [Nitrososphaeraceae archaeon]MDW0176605.1 response regulator [Nitrososphaeraceae archaeon]MDW0178817.1 response regulator [Nitrososphaeraceae archaeon]MDW0179564.1 response regulator [Nitrososphaeraceae archaeon]
MAEVKKRILIVDDEKDVGWTLKLILENYGFDIDCFTDSATALEKFKPNLYDLIILDIRMAEINGFELYDELKSRDSNIKTLFITALSSVEPYNTRNSKVYPLRGVRHFMKKPVSSEELLGQVYSMMVPEEIEDG